MFDTTANFRLRGLRRLPRPGRFAAGFICGLLAVAGLVTFLNNSSVPDWLVRPLLRADTRGNADVIVVLGGGVIGNCVPNHHSLRRVLLGSRLWHEGRAPRLLFTGGPPTGIACSVAAVMADVARDLGVPDGHITLETQSHSTKENAEFSAPILHALGAHRLLIVTDRLHMPRASSVFEHYGFKTERASVPVYAGHYDNVSMLSDAARETVALAYYRMRGWSTKGGNPSHDETSGDARSQTGSPGSSQGAGNMPVHVKNPAGPIVILGASYAGGWKIESLAGIPVINRGISGQQSFELLERFDRDVVAAQPRAVILWGFINDVFRTQRPQVADGLERARQSFEEMIRLSRRHGIEPILATEVTVRPRNTWSETIAGWVSPLVGKDSYQDWVNGQVLETNKILAAMAKREGLLLLDLQPVLSDASGRRRLEFALEDGSHISTAGYGALTSYAAPVLQRHLADR